MDAAAERFERDHDSGAEIKGARQLAKDLEETLLNITRPEDAMIRYRIDDTSSGEQETNWEPSSTLIVLPLPTSSQPRPPSAAADSLRYLPRACKTRAAQEAAQRKSLGFHEFVANTIWKISANPKKHAMFE